MLDSGANCHICNCKSSFESLSKTNKQNVSLADGTVTKIMGQGDMYLSCLGETVRNVLFVPSFQSNLLSVAQLTAAGYVVTFKKDSCEI